MVFRRSRRNPTVDGDSSRPAGATHSKVPREPKDPGANSFLAVWTGHASVVHDWTLRTDEEVAIRGQRCCVQCPMKRPRRPFCSPAATGNGRPAVQSGGVRSPLPTWRRLRRGRPLTAAPSLRADCPGVELHGTQVRVAGARRRACSYRSSSTGTAVRSGSGAGTVDSPRPVQEACLSLRRYCDLLNRIWYDS